MSNNAVWTAAQRGRALRTVGRWLVAHPDARMDAWELTRELGLSRSDVLYTLMLSQPALFTATAEPGCARKLWSSTGVVHDGSPLLTDAERRSIDRATRRAAEKAAVQERRRVQEEEWKRQGVPAKEDRESRRVAKRLSFIARMRALKSTPEGREHMRQLHRERVAARQLERERLRAERRAQVAREKAERRRRRDTSSAERRGEQQPLLPAEPREHQREALAAVLEGFASGHDRGQLVMACGTGKTLTCAWVADRLQARQVLVLVPSLPLVAQVLAEWHRALQVGEVVVVCSDEGVVDQVRDAPVPVTTVAEELAGLLAATPVRPGVRLVLATYQSSEVVARAQLLCRHTFDLVVADEGHRCAGPFAGPFAMVLDASKVRGVRRLFTTATPRLRIPGIGSVSMDDEALFGPVFHRLTFAEAIRRSLLCDYRVVVAVAPGPSGEETTADVAAIALAKAMRRYDLHRVVSFHSRVSTASRFAESFASVASSIPEPERPDGAVWTGHVSGAMSARRRRKVMARLRDLGDASYALVSNARCLSEGIDVPTLDGVAFVDPRSSFVDIVQSVGRAIRLAPDKTVGTIVVPVVLPADSSDHVADVVSSRFRCLWEVLSALRAHDAQLWGAADGDKDALSEVFMDKLPAKVEVMAGPGLDAHTIENLRVMILQAAPSRWWVHMHQLSSYVAERGKIPPAGYKTYPERFSLGAWTREQRKRGRDAKLADDQHAALEALPGWEWSPRGNTSKFEQHFQALKRYIVEHNALPVMSCVVDGLTLGVWCDRMRMKHHQGQLAKRYEDQLTTLEPVWRWRKVHANRWRDHYDALTQYVVATGQQPTHGTTEAGLTIGLWVRHQRSRFRLGTLPRERATLLEKVPGWRWDYANERAAVSAAKTHRG